MEFPDLHGKNVLKDDGKLLKEAIDYAVSKWESRTKRVRYNDMYGGYNGTLNKMAFEYITKTYGHNSRTKYIDYKLPRSKIKTILGEFLQINLDPKVYTINREAILRKYQAAKPMIGLMHGKQEIEEVRKSGLNAYPGLEIPDIEEQGIMEKILPKSENEIAMQYLLLDAVKNGKLKRKLYNCLADLLLTSECFAKVEENKFGRGFTLRFIPSKLEMVEESIDDDFGMTSPYKGEVKPMFKHEILRDFKLKPEEIKRLNEAIDNPTEYLGKLGYMNDGEMLLVNTYTIEVIVMERLVTKKSTNKNSGLVYPSIISNEDYDKNYESIQKDLAKGKYEIDIEYRQALYEVTRIGKDIYSKMQLVSDIVQRTNEEGKSVTLYDYVNLMLGTVDGVRVSLFEMMYELGIVYNIIRFMINRELAKYKGKVFHYDEAYLPKGKTWNDVLHRMTEDSVVMYNSKQAGNDDDDPKAKDVRGQIGEMDLGVSQGMQMLLQAASEIEQALDRITGITDARQGITKASQTATGINTSIEASRAQTQDIFYFFEEFVNDALTLIIEKKKARMVNKPNDNDEMIVGDNGVQFLMDSRAITLDDFVAYIGNGRKEADLKARMQRWVEVDINAGQLRASDVARAEMKETMEEYIKCLENGWDAIQKNNQANSEAQANEQIENLKQNIALADKVREDAQQHDMDKINLTKKWDFDIKNNTDFNKQQMQDKELNVDMQKASLASKPDNADSNNFPV